MWPVIWAYIVLCDGKTFMSLRIYQSTITRCTRLYGLHTDESIFVDATFELWKDDIIATWYNANKQNENVQYAIRNESLFYDENVLILKKTFMYAVERLSYSHDYSLQNDFSHLKNCW